MRRYALAMAPLIALTTALASGSAMVFASRGPCKQSRPPNPRRWKLSARRFASIPTCPPTDPSPAPPATLPVWGDPRGHAASLGDDATSLGDRNAQTASYAALVPPLCKDPDGGWGEACSTTDALSCSRSLLAGRR